MSKINVALIFGGKSGEHEVSLLSTASICKHINRDKYNVFTIGITKEGRWMFYDGNEENIKDGSWVNLANQNVEINLIPSGNKEVGLKFEDGRVEKIDVLFPVLHGPYGEDGTIQGLLELLKIKYVGCKVLASSVSMDKVYTKVLFEKAGIPQANYIYIKACNNTYTFVDKQFNEQKLELEEISEKVEKQLGYPVFVKPSNSGSSVGINKAKNSEELKQAIMYAEKYDTKILIEEEIKGREIECAVLEDEEVKASTVGEILSADEFYTFDAKYKNQASRTVIPAELEQDKIEETRNMAIKAFKAVDGSGLARVDFFIKKADNKVYINEINTMPGFTQISMYPKLWEQCGISYSKLLDKLIESAKE